MLQMGDLVEVVNPFFWYEHDRHEIGEQFVIQEQHVGHGFENWVKKL
jgi:hypothetical protein